jgi:hypothetical protein
MCGCGYVFHGEMLEEPDLAPELAAQEEKLYLAYLTARLEQSISDAENAKADANADPANSHKAERVLEMAAMVEAARADLAAQTAKTNEAVRMAEIAKKQRSIKVRATDKPDKKPAGKPAANVHAMRPKTHKQPHADKQSTAHAVAAAKAIQARRAEANDASRIEQAERAQAEQAARAQAFHAAQTAKANQAMKALQEAKVRELAARSNEAGALFKAHQAARATQIMRAETKDCPNCTASHQMNVQECRCGFVFSNGVNEMPGLALSAGEQAELLRQMK